MNKCGNKELVYTLLLVGVIIVLATPLYQHSGWIMMGVLFMAFLLGKKQIKAKEAVLLVLLLLSFIVWIVSTENVFLDMGRFNTILVAVVMACVFSMISLHSAECLKENRNSHKKTCFGAIDVMSVTLLIICYYNILRYTIKYLPTWANRANSEVDFCAGFNHVDMSVIIMITFYLGVKRNMKVASWMLLLLSAYVLPARTLKAFIVCFVVLTLFRNKIMSIYRRWIILNKMYKVMIAMVVGVVAVCYCWVTFLPQYLTVVDSHQGLFDTSNYLRSNTILYALEVIYKMRLIFAGVITSTVDYSLLVPNSVYNTEVIPHNSYLIVLLNCSIVFGGLYLLWIANFIDKIINEKTMPFIIAYCMCGLILHDMFMGIRMFYFLTVIIIPYRVSSGRDYSLSYQKPTQLIIRRNHV